jgi:hypothetical protein
LPALEQGLGDAGAGLEKARQQVHAARAERNQEPGDAPREHLHLPQEGQRALRRLRGPASRARERAARTQPEWAAQDRPGLQKTGRATGARRRGKEADAALERGSAAAAAGERLRRDLEPFTPDGQRNPRAHAAAAVAAARPQF